MRRASHERALSKPPAQADQSSPIEHLSRPPVRVHGRSRQEMQAPAFSDEALALRFAERHADDLRYVAAWGRWLSWTGTHWKFDDTMKAFDLAREICRKAASECNKAKIASIIASAKTVAAIERLAKADRRLAATVDQWDSDPWLFNTPTGVIDLRTGKSRPARPEDHITKIAGIGPSRDCPRFLQFLDTITAGDAELQGYLRRVLGYALTGLTREHALFFAYGTGANGKSVLLSTVSGIIGDYQKTAPVETFTASNSDRHPTDLAGLRERRLVTAVETEEGRRWAESRIKQLTGGDTVSARFMRQDFFDYMPQFKLLIAGNHKPSLRSVDEAIRRRFHLISLRGHYSRRRARRGTDRKAKKRMARHFTMDDRWLCRLAARRSQTAASRHRRDGGVPG